MKLYATTSSERGKEVHKSGNEFMQIQISNEKREIFASIEVRPDESIWIKAHGEKHFIVNQKQLDAFDYCMRCGKTAQTGIVSAHKRDYCFKCAEFMREQEINKVLEKQR